MLVLWVERHELVVAQTLGWIDVAAAIVFELAIRRAHPDHRVPRAHFIPIFRLSSDKTLALAVIEATSLGAFGVKETLLCRE